MRYFVRIRGVPDEFLSILGYEMVKETDEFKVYLHKGELAVVKKADPFLYVDDLNDARILKSQDLMVIPPKEGID